MIGVQSIRAGVVGVGYAVLRVYVITSTSSRHGCGGYGSGEVMMDNKCVVRTRRVYVTMIKTAVWTRSLSVRTRDKRRVPIQLP